ncbi:MAG: recombination-associated protein RdgC [Myxococcota bacterium]|nr:recombination-associated protein RdgC [Myxococcota bacterium]
MGILKGAVSARHYTVQGEVPEGFRTTYVEALNAFAFQEPASKTRTEETIGWVCHKNLLDTDFTDLDAWLYNHYALFQLRVDIKRLPSNLFKAHLEKECEKWCQDTGKERVPRNVKTELKENLEFEWLTRAFPTVKTTEICWNLAEGYVLFHSHSDKSNDTFRKLFLQTFSLELVPTNPLDLLAPELADALEQTGGTDLRMED